MENTVAERVCTIREKVADMIGESRYRTWFGDSAEFCLDGEQLDVTVANKFVGNWINANFLRQLVEATRTVVGAEPSVHIRIAKEVPAQTDNDPPASRARSSHQQRDGPGVDRVPVRKKASPALRGDLSAFVVGPPNELAFSVATAVVREPRQAFKHLVIHGGCGLGKTHLLQGICNGVHRTRPGLQWRYLSGEEFTNEFIYAVKFGRIDRFRARFRHVDLLVIDDIHFLTNKKATQDEFLHTFNAIDASGKTVVLSCDCHPRSIATLPEALIDRLIAAMVIRVDAPDFATRREILRRRAASMSCALPAEVIDYLARQISRNVRELEGALYKLVAYASLTKEPLSFELAQRVVQDYVASARTPEAADIEQLVTNHFGVTREALHSTSRDRTVTQARGFAMYLIRKHTRLSYPEIGRLMGKKQHSTVLMATRRVQDLLNRDGEVTWKTSRGLRDMPAKSLLDQLEQHLMRGRDGP